MTRRVVFSSDFKRKSYAQLMALLIILSTLILYAPVLFDQKTAKAASPVTKTFTASYRGGTSVQGTSSWNNWDKIRNATTANTTDPDLRIVCDVSYSSSFILYFERGLVMFDTSTIPMNTTITSAILSYHSGNIYNDLDTVHPFVNVSILYDPTFNRPGGSVDTGDYWRGYYTGLAATQLHVEAVTDYNINISTSAITKKGITGLCFENNFDYLGKRPLHHNGHIYFETYPGLPVYLYVTYANRTLVTDTPQGITNTNATLRASLYNNTGNEWCSFQYGMNYLYANNYSYHFSNPSTCRPTGGDKFQIDASYWQNGYDNSNTTCATIGNGQQKKWGRLNFSTPRAIDRMYIRAKEDKPGPDAYLNITKINVSVGGSWYTAWSGNLSWVKTDGLKTKTINFTQIYNVSQIRIRVSTDHEDLNLIYEMWMRDWTWGPWTMAPQKSTLIGTEFSYNAQSLNPGQLYHFRPIVNKTTYAEQWIVNGSDATFLTKPNPPSPVGSTYVASKNRSQINLSWTNYVRMNKTVIVRKQGVAYPTSLTDGVIIYNGTGLSYQDKGLTDGTWYSYSLWTWRSWNGSGGVQWRQWSYTKNSTSIQTRIDLYPQFNAWNVSKNRTTAQKVYFNVTFSDPDDAKPAQVRLSIWMGTFSYNVSMIWKSGSNYTAARFHYNTTLPSGGMWSFMFSATDGRHWNYTVALTFSIQLNVSFKGISFPAYLKIGDYVMTMGTICDVVSGTKLVPVNSTWVHTVIYDVGNLMVPMSERYYYLNGGTYMYTFSTSTMLPGIYTIRLNFTRSGQRWLNQTLYLSYGGNDSNPGPGHPAAELYYTFFNQNTGMQMADDLYKMYISSTTTFNEGNRVKYGQYQTYQGQRLYYRVLDYWNNLIYPQNGSYSSVVITNAETYLDIGIPLNEFLVKNSNDSVIYFKLTNGPLNGTMNTWYAKWVPPQESEDVYLRTGTYNFTIQYYDPITRQMKNEIDVSDFYIDTDFFYWVPGWRMSDIVISLYNVNSSLLNQLINVGVYVNNFNSTILNQDISQSTWLQNLNSQIANQLIYVIENISNWNTTIKNQWIACIQNITNFRSNITLQINSVDQDIKNVGSNLVNQTNLIKQQITNVETNINVQMNAILQNITNIQGNITDQANLVGQWITNLNTSMQQQMNAIQQEVYNYNSTVITQMNVMSQLITNFKTNVTAQLNILTQQVYNENASINTQANVIQQQIDNTRANIINQLNGVWNDINNSRASIMNQLSGVFTSVNDSSNLSINFNMSGFNISMFQGLRMNFTGFDTMMLKLRQILDNFQMPHGWQIPKVDYTVNDTTPPISTVNAYIGIDGSLEVDYSSQDTYGVAYVNLYYKVGNATYWRNWTAHIFKSGTKAFTEVPLVDGVTYWFQCIGTDLSGNVEQPSSANTINLTYSYTAPAAAIPILPITQTQMLYVMGFVLLCIIILTLYAYYKRKKVERQTYVMNNPRQPLR